MQPCRPTKASQPAHGAPRRPRAAKEGVAKVPPAPRPQAPPPAPRPRPQTVQVVAELARGPRSRVVVTIDVCEHARYVGLKWEIQGPHGWWCRRSIAVRASELDGVIDALGTAGTVLKRMATERGAP